MWDSFCLLSSSQFTVMLPALHVHIRNQEKKEKKRKKKRKEKGKRRKGKRRKRKVQKTVGYTEVCRHKTAFALSISTTCTLGVQPLSLLVFPRLHGKPGLS